MGRRSRVGRGATGAAFRRGCVTSLSKKNSAPGYEGSLPTQHRLVALTASASG
jgi:hypothetical protein